MEKLRTADRRDKNLRPLQNLVHLLVLEWHTVTVPFSASRSLAMGFPTILLLPATTHLFPLIDIPLRFKSSITPAGVQLTSASESPTAIRPTFIG